MTEPAAAKSPVLGTPAVPAWGNVRSFADVTINAGGNVVVDADSFLESGTAFGVAP